MLVISSQDIKGQISPGEGYKHVQDEEPVLQELCCYQHDGDRNERGHRRVDYPHELYRVDEHVDTLALFLVPVPVYVVGEQVHLRVVLVRVVMQLF